MFVLFEINCNDDRVSAGLVDPKLHHPPKIHILGVNTLQALAHFCSYPKAKSDVFYLFIFFMKLTFKTFSSLQTWNWQTVKWPYWKTLWWKKKTEKHCDGKKWTLCSRSREKQLLFSLIFASRGFVKGLVAEFHSSEWKSFDKFQWKLNPFSNSCTILTLINGLLQLLCPSFPGA